MVSQNQIRQIRRVRRALRPESRIAYVGNNLGQVAVPGKPGYVYVRYPAGSDAAGTMVLSPAAAVRSSVGAAYPPRPGARVLVGKDYEGRDAILSADFTGLIESGINPIVTNPLMPEMRYTSNDNYTPLMAQPVSNPLNTAPKVTVYSWFADVGLDEVVYVPGTDTASSKIDLTSFVPTAGQQRYVVVWLDAIDRTFRVTGSVAQAITVDLTLDDINECFVGRPPDGVPIKAFKLVGGKALAQEPAHLDLRTLVNVPQLLGYDNPVVVESRLNAGKHEVVKGPYSVKSVMHVRGVLHVI
jgi:hypothetical protein